MECLANGLDELFVVVLAVDGGSGWHGRMRGHQGASGGIIVDRNIRVRDLGLRNGHVAAHSARRRVGRRTR